ncbi:MAG: hypothetical protein SF162_13375 [bacterium]|nr:hypothetical protein [bacterium]
MDDLVDLDRAGQHRIEIMQHAIQPVGIVRHRIDPDDDQRIKRDYQVDLAGFEAWQQALADRSAATFQQYPGLNHLFLPGEGDPNPMEYAEPGYIPAAFIDEIAAWIFAQ